MTRSLEEIIQLNFFDERSSCIFDIDHLSQTESLIFLTTSTHSLERDKMYKNQRVI